MGFKTLDAVLNFDSNILPANTTCAIVDNALKAKGEFLLQHFISQYLSSSKSQVVLFLAFDSIFNHHSIVLRKLGCNLAQNQEQEKFIFLDLATKLGFLPHENYDTLPWENVLKFCFDQIIEALATLDKNVSEKEDLSLGAIIIDDLSVLTNFGCPASRIAQLIVWLKKQIIARNASLIMLTHGDKEFESDHSLSAAAHSLLHMSDIWFRVAPLASGHSLDVHGQMTVHPGPTWTLPAKAPGKQTNWLYLNELPTLHYQLKDNDVKFFPKGTAKGVL